MKALIADRSQIVRDRFLTKVKTILNAELWAPNSDARTNRGSDRGYDPDVVIVDARNPEAEGIELILTLHEDKSVVILLMLSPHNHRQNRMPCEAPGANLLMSPVDLNRELLEAALENQILGSLS